MASSWPAFFLPRATIGGFPSKNCTEVPHVHFFAQAKWQKVDPKILECDVHREAGFEFGATKMLKVRTNLFSEPS